MRVVECTSSYSNHTYFGRRATARRHGTVGDGAVSTFSNRVIVVIRAEWTLLMYIPVQGPL